METARALMRSKWAKVGLGLVILNEIRGLVVVATILAGWYG